MRRRSGFSFSWRSTRDERKPLIAGGGVAVHGTMWGVEMLRGGVSSWAFLCHPEGAQRPKDLPAGSVEILRYAQDDRTEREPRVGDYFRTTSFLTCRNTVRSLPVASIL